MEIMISREFLKLSIYNSEYKFKFNLDFPCIEVNSFDVLKNILIFNSQNDDSFGLLKNFLT